MEEAFAGFAGDVPQVALVDIGLPGMSGIEGVRILRQRHPDMQLLMLTVYRDDDPRSTRNRRPSPKRRATA